MNGDEKPTVFDGPKENAELAASCAAVLLRTVQYQFLYPAGCSHSVWPADEIRRLNEPFLSAVTNSGNVYSLFTRDPRARSEWTVRYVGQRKSDSVGERLVQHLIRRDVRTGSKLDDIKGAVARGLEVGVALVLVRPEALRLYVEETIISTNRTTLPWNKHG